MMTIDVPSAKSSPTKQHTADSGSSSQDICRVCRCEGSEEQPLFYPCLCSGSIKYIHQECLVEWLKHSKKRYCELCKHEFTFTALYKTEPPKRMPIAVYLLGLLKHLMLFGGRALRLALVGFTWIVVVPWCSTQTFCFIFGLSLFSLASTGLSSFEHDRSFMLAIRFVMDVLQGILVNCMLLLLALLVVFLRDYLHSINFWTRLEQSLSPPPVVASVEAESSQPLQPAQHVDEDNAASEAGSIGTNADGITAREYHAFLRRQKLYRERINREQARLREQHTATNPPSAAIAAAPSEADPEEDIEHGSLLSGSTMRNVERRPLLAASREINIRCRVCNGRTCVSLEHVRQASQRQRAALLTPENASTVAPATPATPAATHAALTTANAIAADVQLGSAHLAAAQPLPTNAQSNAQPLILPQPAVQANIQNNPIDVDTTFITVSLSEFFGLAGPLYHLLRNALLVWAVNLTFMQLTISAPVMLGSFMVDGKATQVAALLVRLLVDFARQSILILSGYQLDLQVPCWVKHHVYRMLFKLRNYRKMLDTSTPYSQTIKTFFRRIIAGYTVLIAAALLYVSFYTYYQRARRLVQPLGMQTSYRVRVVHGLVFSLVVVKVVLMTAMELVAFPIFTGVIADLCLLSLIGGSLWSRLSHAISHPLAFCVIHWALGICFMLYTAMLIGKCRRVLREGLLYFLRDPADPDFYPAREMIESHVGLQLMRLFWSAILYAVFAVFLLGGFSWSACLLLPQHFRPLQLSFSDPISEVPLDMLLQTLLRSVIGTIQPGGITRLLRTFFATVSRWLRLSSLIRGGGRYCAEESFAGRWLWLPSQSRQYSARRLSELADRPVEPLDIARLPIIEGRAQRQDVASMAAALVYTEPDLARNRLRRPPIGSPAKTSTVGFTAVFLPEHFALRLALFLAATWLFLVAGLHMTLFVPICMGRWLIARWMARPVHEMYTWTLGMGVVLCISKAIAASIDAFSHLHLSDARRVFFNWPVNAAKAVVLLSIMYGLWPFLVGLYTTALVWPVLSSHFQIPIIFSVSTWVFGVPVVRLAYLLRAQLLDPSQLALVDDLRGTHIFTYAFRPVARQILFPVTGFMVFALLAPPLSITLLGPLLGLQLAQIAALQRCSILVSLLVPLLALLFKIVRMAHGSVRQRIWDDAYVLGRQLRNLDSAQ